MTQPARVPAHLPAARRRGERGLSIIESTVALVVLSIGLLGMAQMQLIGVRANVLGNRLGQATLLARDLSEAIQRMDYSDARIAPLSTVTSVSDAAITSRMDLGRAATIRDAIKPQYAEAADDVNYNSTVGARGNLGTGYTGIPRTAFDRAGEPGAGFRRYWTVVAVNGGGMTGKMILIHVRWNEPGFGIRQVVTTTYKADPSAWQL